MFRLPEWLRARPRRIADPPLTPVAPVVTITSSRVGTNIDRSVIDLYRPHLLSGDCLIVTGYQDFLSSLAILMRELPMLKDPDSTECHVRVCFGVDTANARRLGRALPTSEEMKRYWLERSGLHVEDEHDILAVLARQAILSRRIELRVFDPVLAQEKFGISGDRRMHAKLVASPLGAIAGSANFSRAGLYSNIEYADDLDVGSHELQVERSQAAEQLWEVSSDWTAEALEILDRLIRPVTAEDAMARMIAEQKGFAPWLTGARTSITGRDLLDYQQDLVLEACSIVYDHGIAFVEAPTGSGKTAIGCHLAQALSDTFARAIPPSPVHDVQRQNAAVIAPPRVVSAWRRHSTNVLHAIANTRLGKEQLRGNGADTGEGLRLEEYGVLLIDESHSVTPGFDNASRMAGAIELAPPGWNVCLSATLLGNRDVDWLAHMQEKRASIFMTPGYIEEMGEIFFRESQGATGLFVQGEAPHEAALSILDEPETALSRQARIDLTQMISPFLARRQRSCIGEREDRWGHAYPRLCNHGRAPGLTANRSQEERLAEIVDLCRELAPGGRVTAVEKSRFGQVRTQQSTQDQLHVRNLLNILRVNAAQAHFEMSEGTIGKLLRDFEGSGAARRRRAAEGQANMFDMLGLNDKAETPRCDALQRKLATRAVMDLDEKRYSACLEIQKSRDRVVFLAERTDTLEIFAHVLSKRGTHTNFVVGGRSRNQSRAIEAVFPGEGELFRRIDKGASVEAYFRPGGRRSPEGPASVFLTYKMAEGINLQSADTLVLLGVTSNLKELIQGLGRIDRIDSPFGVVNYHLVDIPVGRFASDEKVTRRLENYRLLSGEKFVDAVQEEGEQDGAEILRSIIDFLQSPRELRDGNFHDVLSRCARTLPEELLDRMRRARIEGTWGAKLALLDGRERFTALHLAGVATHGDFAPPRLLLMRGTSVGLDIIRDQVECARTLEDGLARTRAMGHEHSSVAPEELARALEAISAQLGALRDWDLRPARTESLLKACAAFVSRRTGTPTEDEALFGHLSLQAIEMICESWARLLDPWWEAAKRDVRDSFAYDGLPKGYIALEAILDKVEADPGLAGVLHEKMQLTFDAAERLSRGHQPQIAQRVSVVFFSRGAGEH